MNCRGRDRPGPRAGLAASVQRNGVVILGCLVGLRQRRIAGTDALRLVKQRLRLVVGQRGDDVEDAAAAPERVVVVVAAGLEPEHFLEHLEVVRNGKTVARILVAEEIEEILGYLDKTEVIHRNNLVYSGDNEED